MPSPLLGTWGISIALEPLRGFGHDLAFRSFGQAFGPCDLHHGEVYGSEPHDDPIVALFA